MRIFYLLLLLSIFSLSLYAQPDPAQKATFALSLKYELQLTDAQVQQLDSAEYVFLRDYQMGNSSLKTAEEHQTAYFNYFRPLLKETQQAKLDEIVRQYEEMLGSRHARQEQKARENIRKRFTDLYLTKAQLDSLYVILHPKPADYPEEAVISKRKRAAQKREQQLERIKTVLDRTQYNKYLVIRRTEEEEVLNMQAGAIQQTYAPLQLSVEQAKALFDFEEYDKGLDEKGMALSYWEMQEQRTMFMESILEPHQLEAFQARQSTEIRKYEEQQELAAANDQKQLQATEQVMDFLQSDLLPQWLTLRSSFNEQISLADQKQLAQIRKEYVAFLQQQELEIKAHHQRFNKDFRKDLLRSELVKLNMELLIPSADRFFQQLPEKKAKNIQQLITTYQPSFEKQLPELKAIEAKRLAFKKEHFVMNENWITTYNYQEVISEEEEKTRQILSFLLLSPTLQENLERLHQNKFTLL